MHNKVNFYDKYIFFVMVLLPFVVLPITYMSRLSGYDFASFEIYSKDYYLYGKAVIYVLLSFWGIILLIKDKKTEFITNNKIIIVIALMLLLNVIFSKDRFISLFGVDEQFEGLFILISYLESYLIACHHKSMQRMATLIGRAISVQMIVMLVIALLQIAVYREKAWISLYNSNYAGFFVAVYIPLLYKDDILKDKLSIVGIIAGFLTILLSGAKTALAVTIIVAVLFFAKRLNSRCKYIIYGFIAFICLLAIVLLYKKSYNESPMIRNVITDDKGVTFDRNGETVRFTFDIRQDGSYHFEVFDGNDEKVEYGKNEEGTEYIINDWGRYPYSFTVADYGDDYGFIVKVDGRTWYLYKNEDSNYYYLNGYTRMQNFIVAAFAGFDNHESFATNRGYIWSRSLPLLLKNSITGCGLDTYATIFPQNDINKYLKTDMPYKMIITRPHSIYLQTAIQCGLILLLLIAYIVVNTLYNCKNRNGFFYSAIAFLLCGIFYDSCICITPTFFIILGLIKSESFDKM